MNTQVDIENKLNEQLRQINLKFKYKIKWF